MMEDLTLGGEAVFGPDLLVVDEGALLRAKKGSAGGWRVGQGDCRASSSGFAA